MAADDNDIPDRFGFTRNCNIYESLNFHFRESTPQIATFAELKLASFLISDSQSNMFKINSLDCEKNGNLEAEKNENLEHP